MVLSMAADKAMLDCNCPLGLLESDQSSCMGICTVSQQLYIAALLLLIRRWTPSVCTYCTVCCFVCSGIITEVSPTSAP